MAVARRPPMRARDRRWSLPLLVSLILSGCGGSDSPGGPDAGGNGNLLAVGGSWMATKELLAAKRFDEITRLTKDAVARAAKARP